MLEVSYDSGSPKIFFRELHANSPKISETTRELTFDYLLSPVTCWVVFPSRRNHFETRKIRNARPMTCCWPPWNMVASARHSSLQRSQKLPVYRDENWRTRDWTVRRQRWEKLTTRFKIPNVTLHDSRIHLSPGFFKENHRVKSVIRFDAFKWYLSKSDPANPWWKTLFGQGKMNTKTPWIKSGWDKVVSRFVFIFLN